MIKINNLNFLTCFLAFFVLSACANRNLDEIMSRAEEAMNDYPEQALEKLDSINRESLVTRKQKARYALLYSMALDKNYIDIASDSIIAPAVRYYANHGTALDKLLTTYYNGVIALNAGDKERAMLNYVEAEQYVDECWNNKAIARLYKAKMALYSSLYEHERAIEQGKLAARYFLEDCDTLKYINAVNDIAMQYQLLDDTLSFATTMETIRVHWKSMKETQKSNYYSLLLTSAALHPDNFNKIPKIIEEYQSQISNERNIRWMVIANACMAIDDCSGASYALDQYNIHDGRITLPLYKVTAYVLERKGLYPEAIEAYKQYVSYLDDKTLSVIDNDTKFIEERYISQLKNLKQSLIIIIITFSLLVFFLILVILSQRIKKVMEEKRIQEIHFKEERKVIVDEKEQVEAQNIILIEEKEETEKMFTSLKTEIEHMKKIQKNKSIDKDILASVEQRLNVLNMFILSRLSDSFVKIAYSELGKLMEDREVFLESTRKTFMISHPKFMAYLQEKKLTDWEIGCCCLYCIGFNATEISEYLNRKAIYNVNSVIRQKLNVPKGKTQIDSFLKQKMQEFN